MELRMLQLQGRWKRSRELREGHLYGEGTHISHIITIFPDEIFV